MPLRRYGPGKLFRRDFRFVRLIQTMSEGFQKIGNSTAALVKLISAMSGKTCFLLLILCLTQIIAHADNLQDTLNQQYKKHVIVLRSPFSSGDQEFDSNGKSLNPAPAGPWLSFGAIYVEKLKLSSNSLSIQGYRVAFGEDRKGKQTLIALGKTVQVEIHLEQPLQSIDQVQAVLRRVFLQGASLDDAKPELRRSDDSTLGEPVYHISKDGMKKDATLAPKPIYTPEPEFSDKARRAKFQGTALLQTVIDKTGKVSRVRLERALGYGLDENAMERVKTWRFEPATRNGLPVAVEIKIEVSFKLS